MHHPNRMLKWAVRCLEAQAHSTKEEMAVNLGLLEGSLKKGTTKPRYGMPYSHPKNALNLKANLPSASWMCSYTSVKVLDGAHPSNHNC